MASESEKGDFCPRCKNFIPRFFEIDEAKEARIRGSGTLEAMKELRRLTGCEMISAKIWLAHPTGPHAAKIHPPCPYCGLPLFSEKTQQCLKCGWDWHDPEDPVQRATEPPNEAVRIAKHNARWERYRPKPAGRPRP